jgi:hypothetical protein
VEVLDRAIDICSYADGEIVSNVKVIRMKIKLLDEILACKNLGQIFPILKRAHEKILAEMKE